MARPRVFVSSTYYDLKHIRASLEAFIYSMNYEAVLFESGDIAFSPDKPLDESCYKEIHNCHMLVLIVGGRYGSATSEETKNLQTTHEKTCEAYNSITKKEYETARSRGVPIFIFVDKNVLGEYQTFKENRGNKTVKYAFVDNLSIFGLLDDILAQDKNNFIRGFEKFDDISWWLRDQWAGLFADFLSRAKEEAALADLGSQIRELREVASVLKRYNEVIITNLQPENTVIDEQEAKLRKSRIRRFADEPMISYLRRRATSPELRVVAEKSPTRLYGHFENSNSLKDFLRRAGATDEAIDRFFEAHEDHAEHDYEELVNKYIKDPASGQFMLESDTDEE